MAIVQSNDAHRMSQIPVVEAAMSFVLEMSESPDQFTAYIHIVR